MDRIRVHRQSDGDSGFVTVYEGEPLEFDLTDLRNGVTQHIDAGELEVGSYRQARLHVTDALLELKSGVVFSTRDDTIRLTSQDRSGYKVFFNPPVVIEEGVDTRVLLDFQMGKTFSPVPGNQVDGARFFHLHPSVRAAVLQETGELRGVVIRPTAGVALYVLNPGVVDTELALASTLADADGSAAFLGIPAGTYDVLAVMGDASASASDVEVVPGIVTTFEITME